MSTYVPIPLVKRRNDSIPLSPMYREIEKLKYPKIKDVTDSSPKDPSPGKIPKSSPFELKASRSGNGSSRFGKDAVRVSDGGRESSFWEVQEDDSDPTHSVG